MIVQSMLFSQFSSNSGIPRTIHFSVVITELGSDLAGLDTESGIHTGRT